MPTSDPDRPSPPGYPWRWGGIAHPAWVAVGAVGALVVSYAVAIRRPVPRWELRLTERINDVPEWGADVLYPIMQLGTLAGPVVVGIVVVVVRRDVPAGVATVAAGVAGWFAAKGVKRLVERDRPLGFLPDIVVREGDGSGLGFVSGHSTVAMVAAVMAAAALPPRWRWLPYVVAVLVGLARVVHGVHLPADLIGGWALGLLIALGTLGLLDLARARSAAAA